MGLAAFESFLVTIPCAIVVGIVFLLTFYKMVDGEIPLGVGITAMFGQLFLLYNCVAPPHPMLPGIILVTIIVVAALYPFVEEKIDDVGLVAFEADRLENAMMMLQARPDNVAARFQVAKQLHALGYAHHAVAVANEAFANIKEVHDDFANRSLRDQFSMEERMVRQWDTRGPIKGTKCPSCGTVYEPGVLTCETCQRNYVLDLARGPASMPKLWGRVILAAVAVSTTITGAATIGLATTGPARMIAVGAIIALLGAALYFLFGPGRKASIPPYLRD
jgi:hypothetical protein